MQHRIGLDIGIGSVGYAVLRNYIILCVSYLKNCHKKTSS